MRKLASIQRVGDIMPIERADAIEAAAVEGWVCVVKKGEFQPGDLGVYFEIDSVLPSRAEFEFMWGGGERPTPAKGRVKTKKLRGCISQGLLLPLSTFPEIAGAAEGDEVTELLGVTQYEPMTPEEAARLGGRQKGNFPHTVPKTDETRVQSCLGALYELQGHPYVITLKCDGSSSTFLMYNGEFTVCSRNYMLQEDPDNAFWQIAYRYNLRRVMEMFPDFALQGELVGPGVQKNRLGLAELELRAFTLYNQLTRQRLPQLSLEAFCTPFGIPIAPVVERGDDFQHTKDSLLALAEGKYEGTKNEREGIVIRSATPMFSEHLKGPMSFKAISNRYLLKTDQ